MANPRRLPPPPELRARIEDELLNPRTPPRSRAALAREAGVDPRTITRWATALGVPPEDAWKTDAIRAATEAATDRRRARRSVQADKLLDEFDQLLEQIAAGRRGEWRQAVVLPGPDGAEVRHVAEDDAKVARGIKDLHVSATGAITKSLDIDERDHRPDTADTDDVLDRLFVGLAGAYRALREPGAEPGADGA